MQHFFPSRLVYKMSMGPRAWLGMAAVAAGLGTAAEARAAVPMQDARKALICTLDEAKKSTHECVRVAVPLGRGGTLEKVAKMHGMTLAELYTLNPDLAGGNAEERERIARRLPDSTMVTVGYVEKPVEKKQFDLREASKEWKAKEPLKLYDADAHGVSVGVLKKGEAIEVTQVTTNFWPGSRRLGAEAVWNGKRVLFALTEEDGTTLNMQMSQQHERQTLAVARRDFVRGQVKQEVAAPAVSVAKDAAAAHAGGTHVAAAPERAVQQPAVEKSVMMKEVAPEGVTVTQVERVGEVLADITAQIARGATPQDVVQQLFALGLPAATQAKVDAALAPILQKAFGGTAVRDGNEWRANKRMQQQMAKNAQAPWFQSAKQALRDTLGDELRIGSEAYARRHGLLAPNERGVTAQFSVGEDFKVLVAGGALGGGVDERVAERDARLGLYDNGRVDRAPLDGARGSVSVEGRGMQLEMGNEYSERVGIAMTLAFKQLYDRYTGSAMKIYVGKEFFAAFAEHTKRLEALVAHVPEGQRSAMQKVLARLKATVAVGYKVEKKEATFFSVKKKQDLETFGALAHLMYMTSTSPEDFVQSMGLRGMYVEAQGKVFRMDTLDFFRFAGWSTAKGTQVEATGEFALTRKLTAELRAGVRWIEVTHVDGGRSGEAEGVLGGELRYTRDNCDKVVAGAEGTTQGKWQVHVGVFGRDGIGVMLGYGRPLGLTAMRSMRMQLESKQAAMYERSLATPNVAAARQAMIDDIGLEPARIIEDIIRYDRERPDQMDAHNLWHRFGAAVVNKMVGYLSGERMPLAPTVEDCTKSRRMEDGLRLSDLGGEMDRLYAFMRVVETYRKAESIEKQKPAADKPACTADDATNVVDCTTEMKKAGVLRFSLDRGVTWQAAPERFAVGGGEVTVWIRREPASAQDGFRASAVQELVFTEDFRFAPTADDAANTITLPAGVSESDVTLSFDGGVTWQAFRANVGNIAGEVLVRYKENAKYITRLAFTVSPVLAPQSCTLAGGNALTATRSVAVDVAYAAGGTQKKVYLSESAVTPSSTASGWQDAGTALMFELSAGGGEKKVNCWVMDVDGVVSAPVSDTVTYVESETGAPVVQNAVLNNGLSETTTGVLALSALTSAIDGYLITQDFTPFDVQSAAAARRAGGAPSAEQFTAGTKLPATVALAHGEGRYTVTVWVKLGDKITQVLASSVEYNANPLDAPVIKGVSVGGETVSSGGSVLLLTSPAAFAVGAGSSYDGLYLTTGTTAPDPRSSEWQGSIASIAGGAVRTPVSYTLFARKGGKRSLAMSFSVTLAKTTAEAMTLDDITNAGRNVVSTRTYRPDVDVATTYTLSRTAGSAAISAVVYDAAGAQVSTGVSGTIPAKGYIVVGAMPTGYSEVVTLSLTAAGKEDGFTITAESEPVVEPEPEAQVPPAFAAPAALTVEAGVAVNYSFAPYITPTNGDAYALTGASLPTGLSVAGFAVTGTPTVPGSYAPTMRATDNDGSAERPWSVTVTDTTAPTGAGLSAGPVLAANKTSYPVTWGAIADNAAGTVTPEYSWNGAAWVQGAAIAQGANRTQNIDATAVPGFGEGAGTLRARLRDVTGNATGTPLTKAVEIDVTVPTATAGSYTADAGGLRQVDVVVSEAIASSSLQFTDFDLAYLDGGFGVDTNPVVSSATYVVEGGVHKMRLGVVVPADLEGTRFSISRVTAVTDVAGNPMADTALGTMEVQ